MKIASRMVNSIKKQDWAAFIMEMLAVILGIAITFMGDAWIDNYQTQQNVNSTLRLVVDELHDDIGFMNRCEELWTEEGRACNFLSQYVGNFDAAPLDSMKRYCNVPVTLFEYPPSEQALDLLKSSGLFSKIEDKSLALDIIHAYGVIEDYMNTIKFYNEAKLDMIKAAQSPEFKKILSAGSADVSYAQFWDLLTNTIDGKYFLEEQRARHNFSTGFESTRDSVIHIIDRIEKYYH